MKDTGHSIYFSIFIACGSVLPNIVRISATSSIDLDVNQWSGKKKRAQLWMQSGRILETKRKTSDAS